MAFITPPPPPSFAQPGGQFQNPFGNVQPPVALQAPQAPIGNPFGGMGGPPQMPTNIGSQAPVYQRVPPTINAPGVNIPYSLSHPYLGGPNAPVQRVPPTVSAPGVDTSYSLSHPYLGPPPAATPPPAVPQGPVQASGPQLPPQSQLQQILSNPYLGGPSTVPVSAAAKSLGALLNAPAPQTASTAPVQAGTTKRIPGF